MTKIQLHPSVPSPQVTFDDLPMYAAFTLGPEPPEVFVKVRSDEAVCFRSNFVFYRMFTPFEEVFFLELLTIEAVVRPFSVE